MNRTEMTREEAINYAEAMKAKAQARIEFYRRGHAHAPEVCYSDLAFLSAAISAIREQEKRRWIPVTERLPEKDGQYLCNYHFGNHLDMTFTSVLDYYATDSVPHFQHTLGDTTMKVTHWMPLPELPKGD